MGDKNKKNAFGTTHKNMAGKPSSRDAYDHWVADGTERSDRDFMDEEVSALPKRRGPHGLNALFHKMDIEMDVIENHPKMREAEKTLKRWHGTKGLDSLKQTEAPKLKMAKGK